MRPSHRMGRHRRGGRERPRGRRSRPDRRGRRGRAVPRRGARSCTETATPPSASQPLCTLDRRARTHLRRRRHRRGLRRRPARRHVRARPGSKVLIVDVQPALVDAINSGESHIEDVTSERLRALVDERARSPRPPTTATCEQAHAILIALPTPLSRQREPDLSYVERAATSLAPDPAARPGRRPRVDHVARHDARDRAADPRAGLGAEGGRGLPSRDVARARRPGPRGLDDEDDAEGRRRHQPGVDRRRRQLSTGGASTRCTSSRRPRRPS